MSRFVTQVVLCGANRPYNVALIVPDWAAIRAELNIEDSVPEEQLVNDIHVKDLIDADIKVKCHNLKKFEIPQQWSIVAPFTSANNMLTPKMSIRRHEVIRVYKDIIASMYVDDVVSDSANGAERKVA